MPIDLAISKIKLCSRSAKRTQNNHICVHGFQFDCVFRAHVILGVKMSKQMRIQ